MKVIKIDKGSEFIKKLPAPNKKLGIRAKYHYNRIGKILISADKLKRIHLMVLEVVACEFEIWEWAMDEMKRKNKREIGSGYIQTFSSGATNITTEMGIKNTAYKNIIIASKQFGLDPKSEKELTGIVDPNQGDLWNGFNQMKKQN